MLIIFCAITILSIAVNYAYRWLASRKDLYRLAKELPGPVALPIIGNALIFNCHHNDLFSRLSNVISQYPTPMRIWLGPELIAIFRNPNHVEKIITSSKMTYKHNIYRFLKVYGGDGLISGSGPKWKLHRKIIQPVFHQKFVTMNLAILQNNVNTLLEKLNEKIGIGTFDIHHTIHDFCMDFISEITFGEPLGAQHGNNASFIEAIVDMYDLVFDRMLKVWLQPEILYRFTKHKAHERRVKAIANSFTTRVVEKSRQRVKAKNVNDYQPAPFVDMIIESVRENGQEMSDIDLMHHILTLYAAGEDPMTITTAFTCVCLGMYPECQERAAEEIRRVFGDKPRPVTFEDLKDLTYIEWCIKEVLRLTPIAPFILRKPVEDFTFDEYTIPKGCAVLISIVNLHHDPSQWEKHDEFYPDHFKPEAVEKRHPYTYLPFSGGQRGCIGKVLAMASLKCLMANLLQHYRFEAEGKMQDIKLMSDISVRPIDGYKLKIFKRSWNQHSFI